MIDAQDVIAKLRSAISNLPSPLDADQPLSEQGLDSLDTANLIFEVERIYGIRIDMADAARVETISQLAALVEAQKVG